MRLNDINMHLQKGSRTPDFSEITRTALLGMGIGEDVIYGYKKRALASRLRIVPPLVLPSGFSREPV